MALLTRQTSFPDLQPLRHCTPSGGDPQLTAAASVQQVLSQVNLGPSPCGEHVHLVSIESVRAACEASVNPLRLYLVSWDLDGDYEPGSSHNSDLKAAAKRLFEGDDLRNRIDYISADFLSPLATGSSVPSAHQERADMFWGFVTSKLGIRGMFAAMMSNRHAGAVEPVLNRAIYLPPDGEPGYWSLSCAMQVMIRTESGGLRRGCLLSPMMATRDAPAFLEASSLRDHYFFKYQSSLGVIVEEATGRLLAQNYASQVALGMLGSQERVHMCKQQFCEPGQPEPPCSYAFSYVDELFTGHEAAKAAMREQTSTGHRPFRCRLDIRSPKLRFCMGLGVGEEVWHDVEINRMQDPVKGCAALCIVEHDVTEVMLAHKRVAQLEARQRALLKEILPPQVIEALLASYARQKPPGAPHSDEIEDELLGTISACPTMDSEAAEPEASASRGSCHLTVEADRGNITGSGCAASREMGLGTPTAHTPPATMGSRELSATSTLASSSSRQNIREGAAGTASRRVRLARSSSVAAETEAEAEGTQLEEEGEGVGQDRAGSISRMSSTSSQGLSANDVMALSTWHGQVSIFFCDIASFTRMCSELHPAQVMLFLNGLFSAFDDLVVKHDVYKVETIGDCYVVCAGLFDRTGDCSNGTQMGSIGAAVAGCDRNARLGGSDPDHAKKMLAFAKDVVRVASDFVTPLNTIVKLRIGIHAGPVMTGVVGRKMPRFCLYGDSVNTAARCEQTGVVGKVHVSQAFADLLPEEQWEPTGGVEAKGKGVIETCLLGSLAA